MCGDFTGRASAITRHISRRACLFEDKSGAAPVSARKARADFRLFAAVRQLFIGSCSNLIADLSNSDPSSGNYHGNVRLIEYNAAEFSSTKSKKWRSFFTGRAKGPGGGLGTQRERSARFAQRLTSHSPPSSPEMLKMECFHAARVHAFATCLQQESRNPGARTFPLIGPGARGAYPHEEPRLITICGLHSHRYTLVSVPPFYPYPDNSP